MRLTVNKNTFIYYQFMFFYIFLSAVYFFIFAYNLDAYVDDNGFLQRALNLHDHLVYYDNYYLIKNNLISLALNNDFGIAYIYYFILGMFGIENIDIAISSFVFNLIIFILSSILFYKINNQLNLSLTSKLFFFIGFQFIYFLQLINKDMLTIFIFLLIIYLSLKKYLYKLILLIPLVAIVRLQLVFLLLIFLSLMLSKKKFKFTLITIYISSSLLAAYLSSTFNFIGEDSLEGGFSAYILSFNEKYYYLGYVIFNPIRMLQLFQDILLSFFLFTDNGGVDMSKLLRIPMLLAFVFYIKYVYLYIKDYKQWLNLEIRPIFIIILSYLLVLLMNPTINARYVMLIMPLWFIFVFYAKNYYESKR
jgi:hypothetical protein